MKEREEKGEKRDKREEREERREEKRDLSSNVSSTQLYLSQPPKGNAMEKGKREQRDQ